MERKYEASLSLTQYGKNGLIEDTLEFSPAHNDELPVSHEIMANLAALWLQLRSTMDNTDSTDGEKYTAKFTLSQDGVDSELFSKLQMEPRIKLDDPTFPSAYHVASHIATTYLVMVGVIDENGDLVDEDALDNVSLNVRQTSVH
jgi:hypothetical protein